MNTDAKTLIFILFDIIICVNIVSNKINIKVLASVFIAYFYLYVVSFPKKPRFKARELEVNRQSVVSKWGTGDFHWYIILCINYYSEALGLSNLYKTCSSL